MLSAAEQLIGKSIQAAILKCLPDTIDADGSFSLEQTSLKLEDLRASAMVIRSNASARGQLDSVQLVISQMMKGISPELSPAMSAFFQFVL